MIIFWGGISAFGTRVHSFFPYKEKINSESYMSMLKKNAIEVMKKENLTLCHNRDTSHISQKASNFLANEGIESQDNVDAWKIS